MSNNLNNEILKSYKRYMNELSFHDDGYALRGCRLVISKILRNDIIKLAHEGHLGHDKTWKIIRGRVWFPGIDDEIERFVRQCSACNLTAPSSKSTPIVILYLLKTLG